MLLKATAIVQRVATTAEREEINKVPRVHMYMQCAEKLTKRLMKLCPRPINVTSSQK